MKLNLGCHTTIKPGYINFDKDMYDGVNAIGDISDLSRYSDGTADEIYASHVIEHIPHTKTVSVLKEWHRVLKPGGVLKIAVPDFQRAVELYHKRGMCDWVVNYLWGDQGYDGAFHYTGFNEHRLRNALKSAGFEEIERVGSLPGCSDTECSENVSNIDNLPVSLNMVAIKT